MPPTSLDSLPSTPSPHPTPGMTRPTSHSFSLQRPLLAQDLKKTRNAKRLSLLVPPSPGKLETLAAMPSPSFPPSTSSLSARRAFTPAPLSATTNSTRRHSELLLGHALPTPRWPLSGNSGPIDTTATTTTQPRAISAYFSDYSVECGVASPYTSAPVQVLPDLYLGAEHNAADAATLARLGITFVLNVAVEIAAETQEPWPRRQGLQPQSSLGQGSIHHGSGTRVGGIRYRSLSWTHHQKNLSSEFPKAFAYMDEARAAGGKVLVHCQLGVSRSASLVIAYIMKTQRMNLTDAYDFVKKRSAVISPNMSLMYQLAEFERSLQIERKGDFSSRTERAHGGRLDEEEEGEEGVWPRGYFEEADMMDAEQDARMEVVAQETAADTRPTVMVGQVPGSRSGSRRNSGLLAISPPRTSGYGTTSWDSPAAWQPPSARTVVTNTKSPYERPALMASDPVPRTPLTSRFSIPPVVPKPARLDFNMGTTVVGPMSGSSSGGTSVASSRPSSTSSSSSVGSPDADSYRSWMLSKTMTAEPMSVIVETPKETLVQKVKTPLMVSVVKRPWAAEQPTEARVQGTGPESGLPDFIFSPRPCSPPLLETRNFGDFYQALRMEG